MKKIFFLLMIVFLTLSGQTCDLFGGDRVGVLRSIDGGKSWQGVDELKVKGETSETPPSRVFSLAIDPGNPNIIYAGTMGLGVYKTENKGRTWRRINYGIELRGSRPTIYDIKIDPKNGHNVYLAGISNDYGKIYKSTDGGERWREVFVEAVREKPVYSLAISKKNPKVVLAGSTSGGVFVSTDRGEAWQHAGWFREVISVGINNQNDNIFYAATKNEGAFRSNDFGKSWTGITETVGPYKTPDLKINTVVIGKMAVAPSNGNVVYLGTGAGIYRTRNSGRTWRLVPTTLPVEESPLASDIKVHPRNPNIIYFSIPDVVYKAENSGGKWVSAQLSVNARVNRLAIDPKSPNIIYAGIGR